MAWTTATTRATGYLVTAAVWNAEHVNNMNYLEEVDYVQFTADVTISATVEASANTVVTGTSLTYEAVPHLIEFYCVRVLTGVNGTNIFTLWDGSTDLGRIGQVAATAPATLQYSQTLYSATRITPTAASHQYIVKAWRTTANGVAHAGAGGAGINMPGYIRVSRIPT